MSFVRDKYFYMIVEDFILENNEELLPIEVYGLNIFKLYCYNKYKYTTTETFSEEIINRFLLLWLPSNINKLQDGMISYITESLSKFFLYAERQYGLCVNPKYTAAAEDLKRISFVNKEFSRFLNNPVLSYSPMIIDLTRYKKQKQKSGRYSYEEREKGYFVIKDIFPGNALVLRKLDSGRFVKIGLDKRLIECVKVNDILYMSIKQNPCFAWEIEDVKKYFTSDSYKYIL